MYGMRIVQGKRPYHVDVTIELKKRLMLDEADDLNFKLTDALLTSSKITDAMLGIIEVNDIITCPTEGKRP